MYITRFSQTLRRLRNTPFFSALVVLTIAIGVGCVLSAFSLVQAVLLRPLPFADPSRLVRIHEGIEHQFAEVDLSAPDIATFARENSTFTGVAGFIGASYELNGAGAPFQAQAERVSASLFPVLETSPALGRAFTADEEDHSAPVAVISYRLWNDRFGRAPSALGRTVLLDRRPYTIIGIMSRSFAFPQGGEDPVDLWVPLSLTPLEKASEGTEYDYAAVARLKPGISLEQADADVHRIIAGIQATYPAGVHLLVSLISLKEQTVRSARPLLGVLMGSVSLIMLIAATNLANLFLVRALRRRRELGVRMALGSSRARLLQEILVESGFLSLVGGGLGLALALALLRIWPAILPASLPRTAEAAMNWQMAALALVLVTFTSLICSATPMFFGMRGDLLASLRSGSLTTTGHRLHHRFQKSLIVAESALALLLLITSGLLLRSFERMLHTDPGFVPDHIITASLSLPPQSYPTQPAVDSFYRALRDRLAPLPGMEAIGFSTNIPLVGMNSGRLLTVKGYLPAPHEAWPIASNYQVAGDYFAALRIPLLAGRYFNASDDLPAAPLTAVISQSFATKYWHGQNPVGLQLKVGSPEMQLPWMTVVGVVGVVKQDALDKATSLELYEPMSQSLRNLGSFGASRGPRPDGRIVVRTAQDPTAVTETLRRTVHGLDPLLPLTSVNTMDAILARTEAPRRFDTILFAAFAAIALFLSVLGIYGVIASVVTEQARSIAIRMALGATRKHVLLRTILSALSLAGAGLLLGLLASVALGRYLSSLLFGITPQDPIAYAWAVVLLLLAAAAAGMLPAHRAASVDPVSVIRAE